MNPKKSNGKTSQDIREIIFLQDEKTDLIRTLREERKDYDALANCYKTFNDSDSWPGGFGGNFEFTGEYLEKRFRGLDHSSRFIINAPEDENKIVGVSFCSRSWNLSDAWYVGLIGVDPAYQGQKFGKALLLESTRHALKHRAPLISLHTWGGNLKAMPLYKKQGYKWRPNTSCYLENYLPQILVYPLFQEMFEKYSWYDSFKPVINQIPDEEFDEKMAIYKYDFVMDEENSLEVWIDRSIGCICGFHKKTESDDLFVKATVPNTEAFIGFEEFPITLTIRNNSSITKKFQINTQHSDKFKLKGEKIQEITVEPEAEKIIQYSASLKHDTNEFDMKVHIQNYSEHQIIFDIKSDGNGFPIKIGKAPLHAIKILTAPANYNTIPNHQFTLPLEIINCFSEEKVVKIELTDTDFITFKKKQHEVKISKYDTILEVAAETGSTETLVDFVRVRVTTKNNELLQERLLPIVIFNENKTVVYEFEGLVYIENKHYLVRFNRKPQPWSNEIYITDKLRKLCLNGNAIILGYPFDDDGSEFFNLQLAHEIKEESNGVWIYSTGLSEDKKGVKVTRKVFVPTSNEPIGFKFLVDNLTDKPISDLGIQLGSYWWPGQTDVKNIIIPTKDGIKIGNMDEVPTIFEDDPSYFSEGWRATEYVSGTIGFLCDLSKIDKIRPRRFPSIDYKIAELKGKTSYETPFTYYYFTDSWQAVRKMWQDKFHYSPENELQFYRFPEKMKQFGFINKSEGKALAYGVIIDKNQKTIEVAFDASGNTTLTGKVDITLEEKIIEPSSFKLKSHKCRFWQEEIKIKAPKSYVVGGKITYDCKTKKYDTPIAFAFYDKKKDIAVTKSVIDNKEVLEVNNGFLKFRGSKDFKGYVFFLSPADDDHNYLLTNFPESKPFLWFNRFFGGLGPLVKPKHVWIGDEKYFDNITFDSYEIEQGSWKGIGFKSNVIEFHPAIKGIQVDNRFLTLPDSPIIIGQQVITNLSGSTRYLYTHTTADLKTSNSEKDRYFIQDKQGRTMTYQLQDHESEVGNEKLYGNIWSAFKKADNKYYFGVACSRGQFISNVYPYSPNLTHISLTKNTREIKIQPKDTITLNTLYILTTQLEQIAPFGRNNLSDLLKDK